jgi:hypothetical protein
MKKFLLMIPAAMALLMTSCLEHHVTVTLNKDGSGTITEETLMGAKMLAMMEQMAALGGEGAEVPDPTADLVDKEKAEANAKKMGEGVTLEKVEKIDNNGAKGGRVVYAFKDINAVELRFGNSLGDMEAGGGEVAGEAEKPTRFAYKDGVLTLKNEAPEKGEVPEGGDEEIDPAQMAQAKQMLDGMKMSLKLEFPGGIEETNATHVEGGTVTLMEMDMGKLLDEPGTFAKLQKAQPESPAAMAELLKGVKGMKVDANDELKVKLK